jgi:hypothetical protein
VGHLALSLPGLQAWCVSATGFKNSFEFAEIRRDQSGPRLEIDDLLIQNLKFLKKLNNYIKYVKN